MNPHLIYPRPGDKATVYLKNVITNPAIQVGDFTMYHDFRNDPRAFQENNVLYHYPVNGDWLVMGKFCSIACGAVFLFTSANHALGSLSTYPFPIFFTEWGGYSCAGVPLFRRNGYRQSSGRKPLFRNRDTALN